MDYEQLISKWLKTKLINKTQSTKMLEDIAKEKKESSSSKLITIVSTIGAILLGASALLFISANWADMSSIMKSAILIGSTFAAYIVGYYLKYEKENLPRLGSALLFLGGLLFGATVFLEAQIYNINADAHILLLIWLIGLLPLAYATKFTPLAFISAVVFYFWLFFFVGETGHIYNLPSSFFAPFFLLISMLLFSIGGLHYLRPGYENFAKTYRYIGINVGIIALFFLTFQEFSTQIDNSNFHASIGLAVVALPTILISIANLFFNPQKTKTFEIEGGVVLLISLLILVNYLFPGFTAPDYTDYMNYITAKGEPWTIIYTILYNLAATAVISTLIYIGNKRHNLRLVDMGMLYLTIFVILKYSDWFWNRLEKSLFFFIGGILLIAISIFLERKRSELKIDFSKPKKA